MNDQSENDTLTPSQAHQILGRAGGTPLPTVSVVKKFNHVWRIVYPTDTFFLKTYTKDWYAGFRVAATRDCVQHEVASWRILAANGLKVPEVAAAGYDCENPVGRPFVITRMLPGLPLTERLQGAGALEFAHLMRALGQYMGRMHAITFQHPGYLMELTGPTSPPNPDQWQHFIWTAHHSRLEAQRVWQEDEQNVSPALIQRMNDFLAQHGSLLDASYNPLRYTHGDCHAHQFFLEYDQGAWHVTGVLDMEGTSAGDCSYDFVKFGIEMAGQFPASTRWWEGLFEGCGAEPSFELLQLRFIASGHVNYKCFGARSWPGTREQILTHILNAANWSELFDLSGITSL